MKFTGCGISGAYLIEAEPIRDSRGSFARVFCEREFAAHGLEVRFPQHSISSNAARGTLRGLHFQAPPHGETKLVSCIRGAIFDVCVDLRPDSPTFRQWRGFELSAENRRSFYIPVGCAHGFQTLTDDAEVHYLISEFYAPEAARGVRHDDPAFAIGWPLPVAAISDKDSSWPDFPA
jgi:dTDP-4-dehydrorhamnose 3,5-epimerase